MPLAYENAGDGLKMEMSAFCGGHREKAELDAAAGPFFAVAPLKLLLLDTASMARRGKGG
jgi:hypothetical protein